MVCPLRIIVITVSVVVALTLALIALLSGDDDITQDWQRDEADEDDGGGGNGTTTSGHEEMESDIEDRNVWWKALDFANGRYLYRQYKKLRRAFSPSPSSNGHEKIL